MKTFNDKPIENMIQGSAELEYDTKYDSRRAGRLGGARESMA